MHACAGLLSGRRAEAAVVAALLHDVLDDTEVEAGAVAALFGEQVCGGVGGGGWGSLQWERC